MIRQDGPRGGFAEQGVAQATGVEDSAGSSGSKATILVVDDEPAVRSFFTSYLTGEGFQVVCAASGQEALAAIRERKCDLAVTDLRMPGMDGIETLEGLRKIDPNIEVVVLTGHATVESAVTCMRRGAFDVVQKPVRLRQMGVVLDRALEQRHLKRALHLYEWTRDLLSIQDPEDLAGVAVDLSARVIQSDAVALVAAAKSASGSRVIRSSGGDSCPSPALLEALTDRAATGGDPVLLSPERLSALTESASHSCALAFPLTVRSHSLGALVFLRLSRESPFDNADVRQGTVFASQVALALENARLHEILARKIDDLSATKDHLAALEARTRAIVESALDGILTIDGDGSVQEVNPAAARIFDRDRKDLMGRPLSELVDCVRCTAAEHAALDRFFAKRDGPALGRWFEVAAVRPDGRETWIELSISATGEGGGRSFSVFARDITDRRRLEVERRHAQKLESIGQLAAGIAHEINTPIQYVGDNARFLQEAFDDLLAYVEKAAELARVAGSGPVPEELVRETKALGDEADVEYLTGEIPVALHQSLEGVERVAKIVRAMKEFSHPGEEKAATDLNKAIESTITVARNEWKYVAEIEKDLDPELPLVPCVPGDFNQMILNILVNAAHAIGDIVDEGSGEKGTIRVSTRQDGDWAEVRIADNGAGIPEDIRSRIFDPFFTTKEIGKGTGQGLSIAHAVVTKKHGGTIKVESAVGKGTCFSIRLPITEPEMDATEATP